MNRAATNWVVVVAAAEFKIGFGKGARGWIFSLTRGYSSAKWKLQPAVIKE